MSSTIPAASCRLILINALYVAAEFGAVSVRHSRIQQRAEKGDWLARQLLPVLQDPQRLDRYIAACQIGITISSLVPEEEVAALLAEGARAGVFREAEYEVVERVFWLADETAQSVMTPRSRIVWLDINDPFEKSIRATIKHSHTRFIVCDGELDRVLGIVDLRELWEDLAGGKQVDLRRRMRKPLLLPETILALSVLEQFRRTGYRMLPMTRPTSHARRRSGWVWYSAPACSTLVVSAQPDRSNPGFYASPVSTWGRG